MSFLNSDEALQTTCKHLWFQSMVSSTILKPLCSQWWRDVTLEKLHLIEAQEINPKNHQLWLQVDQLVSQCWALAALGPWFKAIHGRLCTNAEAKSRFTKKNHEKSLAIWFDVLLLLLQYPLKIYVAPRCQIPRLKIMEIRSLPLATLTTSWLRVHKRKRNQRSCFGSKMSPPVNSRAWFSTKWAQAPLAVVQCILHSTILRC